MAQRLTDTNKWERANFRKMSPIAKLAFWYITERCDYRGIWHADLELMSFQTGHDFTNENLETLLEDKLIPIPEKGAYFMPSFLTYQYKGKLNPASRPQASIIRDITAYGLRKHIEHLLNPIDTPSIPQPNPKEGASIPQRCPNLTQQSPSPSPSPSQISSYSSSSKNEETQRADSYEHFLSDIAPAAIEAWNRAYGSDLVSEILPRAWAGWASDPVRQWGGAKPKYIRSWLENAFKDSKKPNKATPISLSKLQELESQQPEAP